MARNPSTKAKILDMMALKQKTLSDISRDLGLAPSTVSQHLQELKSIGAIREVENEHIRKWKYYRLNPEFDYSVFGMKGMNDRIKESERPRMFFYSLAFLSVVAVAYLVFLYMNSNVQASSVVQVKLTDPPTVPFGTQALYINYSGVELHVAGSGGSEWIQSNASGRVDLMSLINVSQVIAGIEVVQGSSIDSVRFNISSASIVINGTSYPVYVPSREVGALVPAGSSVNQSSEILVDFFPTVIESYVNGTREFVLVPSMTAFPSRSMRSYRGDGAVGKSVAINYIEKSVLERNASFSIENASLSLGSNGSISLRLSVKNKENVTVPLEGVLVVENWNESENGGVGCFMQHANGSMGGGCGAANAARIGSFQTWQGNGMGSGQNTGIHTVIRRNGFGVPHGGVCPLGVGLSIEGNGTLEPFYEHVPMQQYGSYVLGPKATGTFYFKGSVPYNGTALPFSAGREYRIIVIGQLGSSASLTLNAT